MQGLTTLSISSNNIDNQGAQYLAQALEKNKVDIHNLRFFSLSKSDVHYLQMLITFDILNNKIGVEGAKYLAGAIERNQV